MNSWGKWNKIIAIRRTIVFYLAQNTNKTQKNENTRKTNPTNVVSRHTLISRLIAIDKRETKPRTFFVANYIYCDHTVTKKEIKSITAAYLFLIIPTEAIHQTPVGNLFKGSRALEVIPQAAMSYFVIIKWETVRFVQPRFSWRSNRSERQIQATSLLFLAFEVVVVKM